MSFNELGLSAELLRAVEQQGYTTPTPIQRQAIPAILGGKDVMAGAQTGTGKTAGFTLPLLQRLSSNQSANKSGQSENGGRRPVRALVLTPTRELAAQVEQSVRDYGQYLPLKSAAIFGGVNINPQMRSLRQGMDILVATPGRLMDHMQQKTVDLSKIEILVLDEADRMLDMGFIPQIRKILAMLPKVRQNLMFSATFSDEIKQLANGILKSPVLIEVARRNASAEGITQLVYPVEQSRKREALSYLIGANDWRQVLVFARTKHSADRLAKQLSSDGLEAAAIHGNKSQGARTRALADFKAGKIRVLVATDIAARGLDIELLPHVVNFDLPNVPEDYVHRIGRTGRAGSEGQALSLVSAEENKLLRDIERLLKKDIKRETLPGFDAPASRKENTQEFNGERPRNGQRRDQNRKPQNRQQQKEAGSGRAQGRTSRNGSTNKSSAQTGGKGLYAESQSAGRRRPRPGAGNQAPKPAYRPKRGPRETSVLLGG